MQVQDDGEPERLPLPDCAEPLPGTRPAAREPGRPACGGASGPIVTCSRRSMTATSPCRNRHAAVPSTRRARPDGGARLLRRGSRKDPRSEGVDRLGAHASSQGVAEGNAGGGPRWLIRGPRWSTPHSEERRCARSPSTRSTRAGSGSVEEAGGSPPERSVSRSLSRVAFMAAGCSTAFRRSHCRGSARSGTASSSFQGNRGLFVAKPGRNRLPRGGPQRLPDPPADCLSDSARLRTAGAWLRGQLTGRGSRFV